MYNYCVTYKAPNTTHNGLMNIRASSKAEAELTFRNAYMNYELIDIV